MYSQRLGTFWKSKNGKKKIFFQFGQTGTCDYSPDAMDTVASLRGYETLPRNDYAAVMNHLATVGPLSVAGKQTT